MKKFEYRKYHADQFMIGDVVIIDNLNEVGQKGWEMCGITNWKGKAAWFYFKREYEVESYEVQEIGQERPVSVRIVDDTCPKHPGHDFSGFNPANRTQFCIHCHQQRLAEL